jgi:hypothetical protein
VAECIYKIISYPQNGMPYFRYIDISKYTKKYYVIHVRSDKYLFKTSQAALFDTAVVSPPKAVILEMQSEIRRGNGA